MRRFTSVHDVADVGALIARALAAKADPWAHETLGRRKTLGMLFLNRSLRTRLSTQLAARHLGLSSMVMNQDKDNWAIEWDDGAVMNEGKAEHVKDAAAVLGRYCDVLAIRAFPSLTDRARDEAEVVLEQFIRYAGVPVVSLESATRHPLQSLADVATIRELTGGRRAKVLLTWAPHVRALPQAVPNSFAEWALTAGHELTIAHPPGYALDPAFAQGATITQDQNAALREAEFIYVKNWSAREPYGATPPVVGDWLLTESRLAQNPTAKVMHCLPVRRNVELSDELLDGPRSLVLHQAANRVWAAQAVLQTMLEAL
jgi:N-succinyl-L-ornithine transcarbamylase